MGAEQAPCNLRNILIMSTISGVDLARLRQSILTGLDARSAAIDATRSAVGNPKHDVSDNLRMRRVCRRTAFEYACRLATEAFLRRSGETLGFIRFPGSAFG